GLCRVLPVPDRLGRKPHARDPLVSAPDRRPLADRRVGHRVDRLFHPVLRPAVAPGQTQPGCCRRGVRARSDQPAVRELVAGAARIPGNSRALARDRHPVRVGRGDAAAVPRAVAPRAAPGAGVARRAMSLPQDQTANPETAYEASDWHIGAIGIVLAMILVIIIIAVAAL